MSQNATPTDILIFGIMVNAYYDENNFSCIVCLKNLVSILCG